MYYRVCLNVCIAFGSLTIRVHAIDHSCRLNRLAIQQGFDVLRYNYLHFVIEHITRTVS